MKLHYLFTLILLTLLSACSSTKSTTIKNEKIVINAFDFKRKEGTIPFYKEKKRKTLALNAVKHKDKYTAAVTTFTGEKGCYTLALTSLKEIDGESSYKIIVDGKLIKKLQNPATTVDFEAHTFTVKNVKLKTGAIVEVQFNSHSNGKIPEKGGFAYSRGRWRKIEFTSK